MQAAAQRGATAAVEVVTQRVAFVRKAVDEGGQQVGGQRLVAAGEPGQRGAVEQRRRCSCCRP